MKRYVTEWFGKNVSCVVRYLMVISWSHYRSEGIHSPCKMIQKNLNCTSNDHCSSTCTNNSSQLSALFIVQITFKTYNMLPRFLYISRLGRSQVVPRGLMLNLIRLFVCLLFIFWTLLLKILTLTLLVTLEPLYLFQGWKGRGLWCRRIWSGRCRNSILRSITSPKTYVLSRDLLNSSKDV